jgi:hypothetical protein
MSEIVWRERCLYKFEQNDAAMYIALWRSLKRRNNTDYHNTPLQWKHTHSRTKTAFNFNTPYLSDTSNERVNQFHIINTVLWGKWFGCFSYAINFLNQCKLQYFNFDNMHNVCMYIRSCTVLLCVSCTTFRGFHRNDRKSPQLDTRQK